MPNRDIVVIGASAGGIEALKMILGALPRDFAAAVFIVVHMAPSSPGLLAQILDRVVLLPAAEATNRERIRAGRVYVAPPDHHMLVTPGKVMLSRGPRENRFRPAVDPLFRSAAQTYGPRVIGVILTGGLDDGTNGLWTVKQLGGVAIVQDPAEALAPSMPLSALAHVRVDHTAKLGDIAGLLVDLTSVELVAPAEPVSTPRELEVEVDIAKENNAREAGVLSLGSPSNYACPACRGVLLQMKEASPLRFRCHTGHAYTLESLVSEMDEMIEDSLWNAIRALEERVMVLRQAGAHARQAHAAEAGRLFELAEETQRRADLVRQAVMHADATKANGAAG